jgi:hypothetical protein
MRAFCCSCRGRRSRPRHRYLSPPQTLYACRAQFAPGRGGELNATPLRPFRTPSLLNPSTPVQPPLSPAVFVEDFPPALPLPSALASPAPSGDARKRADCDNHRQPPHQLMLSGHADVLPAHCYRDDSPEAPRSSWPSLVALCVRPCSLSPLVLANLSPPNFSLLSRTASAQPLKECMNKPSPLFRYWLAWLSCIYHT